jgi:hypothetical protein
MDEKGKNRRGVRSMEEKGNNRRGRRSVEEKRREVGKRWTFEREAGKKRDKE